MWDPADEQSADNRREFREWAETMAKRMDYEVVK
jgi:hypothetical protein